MSLRDCRRLFAALGLSLLGPAVAGAFPVVAQEATQPDAAQEKPARPAGEPVYPSSSRFGFVVPSDMSVSKRFMGFERREGGAMLSVVELPAEAYPEIEKSFTDENLKAQGFLVQAREAIKVNGGDEAVLYSGELPVGEAQGAPPGMTIRKWILLVKGADVTGIVVAQMTPGAESEAALRAALTGITIRPALSLDQQVDSLPFRFVDLAGFRAIRVLAGNSVLLTRGPKDLMANLEQPILVLAQAVQQPPPAEQRDGFARAALYSNQTMKDFFIERSQGYRQNGVDWHEIVARATDIPSSTQVVVTQTIRFNPDGYLRALGVVRAEQRDETLASFREVVDSVQMK